jgi:hypothetical protein
MSSRTRLQKDLATLQLECAQQVVSILFEKTGLSTILRERRPNLCRMTDPAFDV